jgi:hypothetical protein
MAQDTSYTGQTDQGPGTGPSTAQRNNGLAVAGLVCGLAGLVLFNYILGPLAIIFGGIGWSRGNRGANHKGMAIAAVVLGIVDLIVWIVLIVALAKNGGYFSFHAG